MQTASSTSNRRVYDITAGPYRKCHVTFISSAMLVRRLTFAARNQEFEQKELQILKGEVPHQIDILAEVTPSTCVYNNIVPPAYVQFSGSTVAGTLFLQTRV